MAGTEGALFDFGGAGASWIPDKCRIGSQTGPAFWQLGQQRIAVVRGDNTSAVAEIQARSFVMDPTTSSQSGAVSIDLSANCAHIVTLTGNATGLTFANPASSGSQIELHLVQDATGSRTLAGPNASIKWAGGVAPTLSTTANRRDIFTFRNVGGSTFYETSRSMNVQA
jgi:hypothetical protein